MTKNQAGRLSARLMRGGIFLFLLAVAVMLIPWHSSQHKRCNHGASSISGEFRTIKGKRVFVVTTPVHKTGC